MLVLTRRIGETVVFGEDIYCTVLGIKGNQARLGITAHSDVSVHRAEIFMKAKAEQMALIKSGHTEVLLTDVFRAHQKSINWQQLTH